MDFRYGKCSISPLHTLSQISIQFNQNCSTSVTVNNSNITCKFYSELSEELICGNKMPTRCNRWFLYCRSYCLLNMFRAPLCPSSGAQEYYTGSCCLWYFVLWFSSCQSGAELWVVCPLCGMLLHPTCIILLSS